MGIVTSFDSSEPDHTTAVADYMGVVQYLGSAEGEALGEFVRVAKRHLHQRLPPVRLLAEPDDAATRWAAFLTVVLDKADAVRLEPLIWREKWAGKMHELVCRLADLIMADDPQNLALVGSLRCAIVPMVDTITVSVKQKWTFSGA